MNNKFMALNLPNNKYKKNFPDSSMDKESACNAGDRADMGLIPGSARSPGERNGSPLQYFLPEKPHALRGRVGYSPWGHKESNMAE